MADVLQHHALDHQLKALKPFIEKEGVTEIFINKPGQLIYLDAGSELHPNYVDMPELTLAYLKHLAKLIAVFNGKTISDDKPILTASLLTGERVQIIYPPAVESGTISFTIRIPCPVNKTLDQLDEEGAFNECKTINNDLQSFEHDLLKFKANGQIKEFLELAIASRRNIVIAGQTGSGKTTIAKSMIECIPRQERLITLESESEIDLSNFPNKVHLFYSRSENSKTHISPKECLAACLRMNPSRILMAEILGDESWDYIKSINTGHAGSITTMHANGSYEAFEQLVSLVKDSPKGAHLDAEYIKRRLISTIDIVLFYSHRKLQSIYYNPDKKHEYLD